MTFVKSRSQKHDREKSTMIFPHDALLCRWKTPLNILILLHCSSATLVPITPITSNFVGSVCNNIMLCRKVALPLFDCCLLRDHAPHHNSSATGKKYCIELILAIIYIPNFIYY